MNAGRSNFKPLSELPAHCLRRLGRASVEQVQSWAAEHQEQAAIVALEHCATQAAAMRVFAGALQLPQWFGANLDALYDALTDLPGDAGWNLVVSGLAHGRLPAAAREALLEVLRDAVEDASGRSRPFRVLYD